MLNIRLFGVLIASAALAACGGGGDSGAEAETPTPPAEGVTETAATEPAADAGETMEADAPAEPAPSDMTEPEPAESAPAEEPAATEEADASGGDGQIMVAGLTGNPEAGARVFARCRSCHVLDEGVNRNGPSLYGIIGRTAGSVEGFRYSPANADSGIVWTEEIMFEYLENPREYIPGTYMAFPGLRAPQDRADVIAYIQTHGGNGG